jgi:hypothetical protein
MLVTQHISNIFILYYNLGIIWFIMYTLLVLYGFLWSCVISCLFIEFPTLCALSKFIYLKTLLTFLIYLKVTHISFLFCFCAHYFGIWIVVGFVCLIGLSMLWEKLLQCVIWWPFQHDLIVLIVGVFVLCVIGVCASRFDIIGWTYGQQHCEWEA